MGEKTLKFNNIRLDKKEFHKSAFINAYKDFHLFACISVIKTLVTNVVLKDKIAQH